MKRYLTTSAVAKAFMAMVLAIYVPSTMAAQEYENTPVTISKEKVRIDGQVCYSHVVKEKQTLFSICKAYDVTLEDIYRYNPSVKEKGLKMNSILIIPVSKQGTIAPEVREEAEVDIAQKKPAERKGKELRVPKRKKHTVKWYEDIESIAYKYGVSVSAIMKANNLTSRQLTKRQKLTIPNPGEYLEERPAAADEPVLIDSTDVSDKSGKEAAGTPDTLYIPKKKVSLSLLLPLKANGTEGSRQNMDFYSGVLMAVYDMSKEGISTELDVYDVAEGKLAESCEKISGSDITIGPVSSREIAKAFEYAPDVKSIVSPLDQRAESVACSHKNMIQAPTPHMTQYNDLFSWIKEDMKEGDRVLFITEKGAIRTDAIAGMKAAADSSGLEYQPLSYSILEGRGVTETLTWLMSESGTNRVFIASESEAFVNDVVRNLNVMIHQKYDVVLYAPSKIRSFETIEVENFHNTSLHVSAGYNIDYDDPEVMEFLLNYRALFNTEPTQFAYQGYDLAKYFIGICSEYGDRWMEKLEESRKSMLQSTFEFIRIPEGGYVNSGVRRVIYKDNWTVEKVR